MKKGISIWAFDGTDLKSNLKLAADLGFEGVELSFDEEGPVSPATTKEEAAEIAAYAKELGLSFYSMASGQYWSYSITSDDEAMRQKAISIIKDHIRVASYFGCETILVVPGWVKVNFIPGLPQVDYVTAYERALKALKEIAPFAEKHHVTVAVENVGNMFLVSPVEMREFIDKVGSDYVASYFDVGNVLYNGCPEHWIRALGSRIRKIHFKDYAMVEGVLEAECDLLRGDVNYDAVMDALKEIGYDGWVTAEVFPYKKGNIVMLKHTAIAMDYILTEMGTKEC